jgi:hypothetical protein
MRIFLTLALSLAALVVALRLPIGARPDVASSSTGVAVAPVSVAPPPSPFGGVFRMQTRADLRVVLTTASRVFPVWKSYVPAMPTVLERALPQFEFVHATQVSSRVGEMSVAASTHRLVLAEFAGPDGCTYARVIDRHSAETATRVSASGCRAASAPAHGWTALDG